MDWQIPNQIEIMGGVNFFQFVEIDKILTIPRQYSGEIGEILLKDENTFQNGYATPNTLEMIITPTDDDQGTIYDVRLTGEYPVVSPAMINKFRNMLNRKYLVLAKNSTGRSRVLGSVEEPLKFSFSEKSGKVASDRPAIQFSFLGKSLHHPYYYAQEIIQPSAPVLE